MVETIRNAPCVYFISDGCGHCKIGVASDIYSRFNTLQVGSAYELSIVDVVYTETLKEAYETENHYHTILREKKVRGEWFEETAVKNILSGRTVEGEKVKYLPDYCQPGEFNFNDLINYFLLGLETCKNPKEFHKRFEEETPEYFKKALAQQQQNKKDAG